MSLNKFFVDQFDQLKEFMVSPDQVVRSVRIDPEMKPMFHKALVRMEDAEDFPHSIMSWSEPFVSIEDYFQRLLEFINQQFESNRSALAEFNVNPAPARMSSGSDSFEEFLRYSQGLAESLPDSAGSLIFLLDPESVDDPDSLRKAVHLLSSRTKSRWLKFIVLDRRVDPLLQKLSAEDRRIFTQTFYLGPKKMEQLATWDVAQPDSLSTPQGRQTLGLLAGFAIARKEFDRARELQDQWVAAAQVKGDPGEVATALYNLGNTLLGSESFEEATAAYCKASRLCIENELDALLPFIYTNLGVCLHRQGEFGQAFDVLRIARDIFKVQKQRPGRAYVIDTLAGMYALDGKNKKAERAWLYALSLYEGITPGQFSQLRENGMQTIIAKLEAFYQQTVQPEKLSALKERQVA